MTLVYDQSYLWHFNHTASVFVPQVIVISSSPKITQFSVLKDISGDKYLNMREIPLIIHMDWAQQGWVELSNHLEARFWSLNSSLPQDHMYM